MKKACRNKSIVELLISMCYDEEEATWQYTKDGKEIICNIGGDIYHGFMSCPQSLTLVRALHIPLYYSAYADKILSNKTQWPVGVEYIFDYISNKGIDLSIRIFIDLDYKDSPKEYLRGYFNYAHELQTEIHKELNQFKNTHNLT